MSRGTAAGGVGWTLRRSTSASPAAVSQSRSYAVRWRWSLIIFLGVVAAVAFNTAILADEVRVAAIEGFHALPSCRGCTPTYPEPFAIFLIATFACVLAVVAAIPAIVVIGLLGRRVGLRPSAISATALLATLLVASVGARVVTWSSAWLGASEPGATGIVGRDRAGHRRDSEGVGNPDRRNRHGLAPRDPSRESSSVRRPGSS